MKSFGPDGPGPVPKLLLRASAVVLVASAVLLVAGAFRIGVTWDESYHVQRYDNYVETGWYVIDAQSDDGEPFDRVTDQYVYGPATMAYLHALNRVVGHDPAGSAGTTADAYLFRHLGIVLLGFLALFGMAVLGRLVLRRWDWGVVAAAVLASVPMWTGHAMFNLKDVPVATGYVWLTVGLCLLARERAGSWGLRGATIGAIAGGSWLMIGTRPGMWTAAVASTVALLIATHLRESQAGGGHRAMRWRLAELAAGSGVAYGGLVALYPNVFLHPLTTAYESANNSANFLGIGASRAFVPVHVLLQMPLLILALVLLGVVTALLRMRRVIRAVDVVQVRLTVIGVQLLTLPLITVFHPSALYGDLRQLLFAAPAAALFGALGAATVVVRVNAGVDRVPLRVVTLGTVLAMALPAVSMAMLFPYTYTYYNVLSSGEDRKLSPEYYRASGRELLGSLPREGRVVCSPITNAENQSIRVSQLDGAQDCRTALASPIAAFAREAGGSERPLDPDEFWTMSFTSRNTPENCETTASVRRPTLRGTEQLGTLRRCRLTFPVLGEGRIAFGVKRDDPSWAHFDEGWDLPAFSPDRVGFHARPEGGSIGFRLTDSSQPRTVEVGVRGAVDRDTMAVLVDGADTPFEVLPPATDEDEDRVRFLVPPGGGTHRVEFRPRGTNGFDLYLLSIALGGTS